jgi:hypothetical protein
MAGDVAQAVRALSSNPSATKKKKKNSRMRNTPDEVI